MRRQLGTSGRAVGITLMGVLLFASSAEAMSSTPWRQVGATTTSPEGSSDFSAVYVASAQDAWIGGAWDRPGHTSRRALIERWNGKRFEAVSTPFLAHAVSPRVIAMGGTGSKDVWAVGTYATSSSPNQSLIEHFNGTTWQWIQPPANEPPGSELHSVSADSPSDVWAVGLSNTGAGGQITPLVEHFNGTRWTVVTGTGPARFFFSVAAISPTDVWAVGRIGDDIPPVVEHFDGTSWTQIDQPAQGQEAVLYGISAVGPHDIWMVGQNGSASLVEHWNGSQWSIIDSPNGPNLSPLVSVTAVNSHDVWAVGDTSFDLEQPLAEHFDGTSWTMTTVPNPGIGSQLEAVSAAPGGSVFAVGNTVRPQQPYHRRGLVLRH